MLTGAAPFLAAPRAEEIAVGSPGGTRKGLRRAAADIVHRSEQRVRVGARGYPKIVNVVSPIDQRDRWRADACIAVTFAALCAR